MKPSILGIGPVSALGCGIETLKEGLLSERRPNIVKKEALTATGAKTLPVYTPVLEGLERFIPRNKLRRMDGFLQMGLLSSYLAIEDGGINIIDMADKSRVAIVFGTGYGPHQASFNFFDTLINDGDKCASPTIFANSVHNSVVSNVSISLGIEGPCQTLTCFDMTTAAVFSAASSWIESGIVDYVLAGIGDEYCELRGYATLLSSPNDMNGMNYMKPLSPMDFNDCTYIPGEGFVSFLLGREEEDKGYGKIDSVETGKIKDLDLKDADAHFLAANGNSQTGPYYNQLDRQGVPASAYSSLYGAMPVGQGFDVAIAALSLKYDVIYSPDDGPGAKSMSHLTKVGCIQCDDSGNGSVINVSKNNADSSK